MLIKSADMKSIAKVFAKTAGGMRGYRVFV